MPLRSLTDSFWQLLNVRPGEPARIGMMAGFLFFLLAANNVIKVVRDSLFLSRFPITQLPYVYLMTALFAGAAIGIYSRYTTKLSLTQVILGTHVFLISNAIIFWLILALYDFGWMLYVFYMWAGIVGLVVVAQFWTLADNLFTPREGKRLFGILTLGGTLGGLSGGLAANWAVSFLFETKQLLWLVVALFGGAAAVVYLAVKERGRGLLASDRQNGVSTRTDAPQALGVIGTLRSSGYLQSIAALLFVSVIVSTLIDYQFKALAKEAYPSTDALAVFFGAYYVWLSTVTIPAQLWLAGKLLTGWGLTPSLLSLPVALLAGSVCLLVWPGLVAVVGIRLTEASLRTSIHRSGVEILYLPIPDLIKKRVKVFLDVTIERLGDGTAAFLILFYVFFAGGSDPKLLSYFAIGLILVWAAVVLIVRGGYVEVLRNSIAHREESLERARIDFDDKDTIETVMNALENRDERSVLFALDLAEELDPKVVAGRLPRSLLRHASPRVRRRALIRLAQSPDASMLGEVFELLGSESAQGQTEPIKMVCNLLEKDAIPFIQPFLKSPESEVQGATIYCMLQKGDANMRQDALTAFRDMVTDLSPDGERSRIEAARLMGELDNPEFSSHLSRLISEDPSPAVIRASMAAAGRRRYPDIIREVIPRLGSGATKAAAREALVQYGEMAVKELRSALFDNRVSRQIRLNIPRTLSKIHSQSAMNALVGGLLEEDRSIRFKVILAIEEMARRFPDLKAEREIIESAIISDVMLYSRRFAIYLVLFGQREGQWDDGSLLRYALTDSMERVRERVMWLLALIYHSKDIRSAWIAVTSADPIKRAHGIEFLDNLLTGDLKRYVFPLFSDAPPAQRFKTFLSFLGIDGMSTDSALTGLLKQDDIWLKAATVWEIGLRGLNRFRDSIRQLSNSEDVVLREAAGIVIQRM